LRRLLNKGSYYAGQRLQNHRTSGNQYGIVGRRRQTCGGNRCQIIGRTTHRGSRQTGYEGGRWESGGLPRTRAPVVQVQGLILPDDDTITDRRRVIIVGMEKRTFDRAGR